MCQQSVMTTLTILHQEDVWICDTGASNHVTWCNKGARNIRKTQSLSLGHTSEAIETTAMIDVTGLFVLKTGEAGVKAVLKECSYDRAHNFNLLSMSRHKQG
jgi:hypothetical protein